jgi:pyruvate dehydrogenase E1 component beta subunit
MQHTFIEILRRALDEELARDPTVHLLGEDVAAGGAFGVTKGLAQKHGAVRVRNTPISEAAITGLATGAALCGLKPVLEIMFIDFATLSMDCLVNQTAKYRYMSGASLRCPWWCARRRAPRARRRATLAEPRSLVHPCAGAGGGAPSTPPKPMVS